jgi:hypothetical protein
VNRTVRAVAFRRRPKLVLSAACLVANSVRESLSSLLGREVRVRLLRPLIPEPQAWQALCADAMLFCVRGCVAEAAFVLRPPDALALACAAFEERAPRRRDLSALERQVVMRALERLGTALAPLCGRDAAPAGIRPGTQGFVTYFELLLSGAAELRLGVALSREPTAPPVPALRPADLLEVEVETRVVLGAGEISAKALLGLGPGAEVPMKTRVGAPSALVLAGVPIAWGDAGISGGHYALIVTKARRGNEPA